MSNSRKRVRKQFHVYLTDEEMTMLKEESARAGLNASTYLVSLMHKDIERSSMPAVPETTAKKTEVKKKLRAIILYSK